MTQENHWRDTLWPTISASGETLVVLPGTTAMVLPIGDTAERPASPFNGMMRYNTDSGEYEIYNGGWANIDTSAGVTLSKLEDGDGNTEIYVENFTGVDDNNIVFTMGDNSGTYVMPPSVLDWSTSGFGIVTPAGNAAMTGVGFTITTGAGNVAAAGGAVNIITGTGGATGNGGGIGLTAGAGGATSGDGGNITLTAGAGTGGGSAGAVVIPDSTTPLSTTNKLYSVAGALTWNGTDISGGGGGGGVTVEDEGITLATVGDTLNFVGAGVVASGAGTTKTITIAGGGGGLNNVVEDLTPQLGGDLDVQTFAITSPDGVGVGVGGGTLTMTAGDAGTSGVGGDITFTGGVAAPGSFIIAGQNQTNYDSGFGNGSFVGGDGVGGTAYVAFDTITLSDGSVITVDSVDGNGDVVTFTVTTSGLTTVVVSVALTQSSTSGTGTAFTLTPALINITTFSGGTISLLGGIGTTTSDSMGGSVIIIGGPSGVGSGTDGGPVNIVGGSSSGSSGVSRGGAINITGGTNTGSTTSFGGTINITGGGGYNRDGGDASMTGGYGYGADGGTVRLTGGATYDDGADGFGGDIIITGGEGIYGSSGYSYGGDVRINGGDGHDGGGDIKLYAGETSNLGFGGDIDIRPGLNATFTTNAGVVNIRPAQAGFSTFAPTQLRFHEATGNPTAYVSFEAAATIVSSVSWILPVTDSTGTQALVSDGAGTLSWSTITGGGDVSKVGTPVNNQIGVWTGDGTIEGDTGLTWDGTTLVIAGGIDKLIEFETQTGTTFSAFTLAHSGEMVTMNNAGANTVTLPANSSIAYPIGTEIHFQQLGAGATTIAITTDTLNVNGNLTLVLNGQYAVATALKMTATTWTLFGNLVPA